MRLLILPAIAILATAACNDLRDPGAGKGANTPAARRDTAIIDGTAPSCASCRIEIMPPLRLGTTEDEHIPQRVPEILRDGRGTHYLTFDGWGNKPILRYDSTGRYIGQLGRYGQGPGEYTMTFGAVVGPGDSLLVMLGGPRALLYAPDGSFARSARVPNQRVFALAADGSGTTYAIAGESWGRIERERHVVRFSAGGAPLDSFPVFSYVRGFARSREATGPWFPIYAPTHGTLAPDGSVWTLTENNYRLEHYRPDGRSLQVIGVTTPGPHGLIMTRAQSDSIAAKPPESRPPPRRPVKAKPRLFLKYLKTAAAVDSSGLLWVVRTLPAPSHDTITFKGRFLAPDEAPGEMTIPRDAEDRLYQTIVDVIDPAVPALLARAELPFLGHMAAPGYIGRVTVDESEHYIPAVYRLVLRRGSP